MDLYDDDDKVCFQNIHFEMNMIAKYIEECNTRKFSLFRLSLTVFTAVVLSMVTIFEFYAKKGVTLEAPFNVIAALILVFVGLINIVIVKELLSIHASRLISFRQLNCLRHALDSIKYKKFEGEYPNSIDDLKNKDTKYWKAIGKHRKLPLNNEGLKHSDRGIFRSPDKFMVLVLVLISTILIFTPLGILSAADNASYTDGLYSAVIGVLYGFGIKAQFTDARIRLNSQLKFGNDFPGSNIPPVN